MSWEPSDEDILHALKTKVPSADTLWTLWAELRVQKTLLIQCGVTTEEDYRASVGHLRKRLMEKLGADVREELKAKHNAQYGLEDDDESGTG